MKLKGRVFLTAALVLMVAGGLFSIQKVLVLQVLNTDRARKFYFFIAPASQITLSYIHSIYLQPAAEEFEVGAGEELILKGVRTQSPAVATYYGFEEGQEYYPVNRRMKSFFLRVGMTNVQTLDSGTQKISLQDMGEKGDRMEFRVVRITWAHYLLSRI